MNKFISDLATRESENIKKIYEYINITLDVIAENLKTAENRAKYDDRRGVFIIPIKDDESLFAAITHNAVSMNVEIRYVDAVANQETVIGNLLVSSSEITEQKRLDLIKSSDDLNLITDLFWYISKRIFDPVGDVPAESPDAEETPYDEDAIKFN
jgi:hypothetical protein